MSTLLDEPLDDHGAWDAPWVRAAEVRIRRLAKGTQFIAEDVLEHVRRRGFVVVNARMVGELVRRLERRHIIARTGTARPARTSHGALKPVWIRL